MKRYIAIAVAAFATACATKPESIAPAYVSELSYQAYSCDQLGQEQTRLSAALATSSDAQRHARSNDIAGVILLGLPVSSLSGSNQASQIARLKGELEAIQKSGVLKNCTLTAVQLNPPPATAEPVRTYNAGQLVTVKPAVAAKPKVQAATAVGAVAAAPVAIAAPATAAAIAPAPVTTAAPATVYTKVKCEDESVVDNALCNGKLHLGMTFRDVISALGKPSSEANNFQLLTYGRDVLTFDDSQLLVSITANDK